MKNIILRNAKLISGERIDLAIREGKIAEQTAAWAWQGQADSELDCTGLFLSSGWIDMHVHAYAAFSPYGDEIDEIGVRQGAATIVDAGSCGADNIANLFEAGRQAKTNLLAFLNISRIGLERIDELSNMEWIDFGLAQERLEQYGDFIAGFKARISRSVVGTNELEPLRIARRLADECGQRMMVHIGSGPPHIEEILPLLCAGDIITHYLHGKKNGLFANNGEPIAAFAEAISRGVVLDTGHGRASFSFQTADYAKRNGIVFDTISTDIYRDNRLNGPVYSISNVLSKFLYLGYPLEQIIQAVTVRPARWLGRPELGRIQEGDAAHLTLFSVEKEEALLVDSEGETRQANQMIYARGTIIHDEFIKCEVRAKASY